MSNNTILKALSDWRSKPRQALSEQRKTCSVAVMVSNDSRQTFLFTFRRNGEAHGEPLVEVLVEQLADYDPSVADDSYRRAWFGTMDALSAMLESLGFSDFDVQGVAGALHTQRDADRRMAVTPDQLQGAGFKEI